MASANVFAILSLLFSPDAPHLPEELVAASLQLRHQFLGIGPDQAAYYQLATANLSEQVNSALENIRTSEWEISELSFWVGCREEPETPELLARTTVHAVQKPEDRLDVVLSFENPSENSPANPVKGDGDWKFLTLIESSSNFPISTAEWHTLQEAAANAFSHLQEDRHTQAEQTVEDYWGDGEEEDVIASAVEEFDNGAMEDEYWAKYNGQQVETSADKEPSLETDETDVKHVATNRNFNPTATERQALEQSLSGILQMWMNAGNSAEERIARINTFRKLADLVAEDQLQLLSASDE